MKMTNRTVLITGGTSGIGLTLANSLVERGNIVIVTGRDQSKLTSVSKAFPRLYVVRSDVTKPDDIRRLYEEILSRFPKLDVLVNNAGIMRNLKLVEPHSLEDITREVDILLTGAIRMVQQFLPHLLQRDEAAIVNVSSGLAFVPMPVSPVYSAAKAALHAYTQSLRAQLSDTSINVIELAPPPVETELFRGEFAEEMKGRSAMAPDKLVKQTLAAIEAGRTEIRPGAANILKIASRIAPDFIFKQMVKLGQPRNRPI
ncbi:SDR family oxidoreductase [Beijerinckia indica]|uniref:Short-chain dehydrogenase/reductase SDR n=1 Tax=Beijerinckia indica subsp. indica (strain ATCC 9039 / DSM 1715 / NCIMB 8712) TaxID=395963 RepID=B2II76_BEII9|nr:SDR family NAD(P)-dependent oxidoreductase [Beijerinckia indica]ACB94659.1 short-chain dehydrogenase/reductase SDR [Beijerinckia indica subsp. indica ATCC 9039]